MGHKHYISKRESKIKTIIPIDIKTEYHTYRYQNRNKNKKMTVYVKVDYAHNGVNVEFVDKVRMNPGSLGIDNKISNVLDELTDAIETELSADA